MDPGLGAIVTGAKLTLLGASGNGAKPTNHVHSCAPLVPLVVAPSLALVTMTPSPESIF